MKPVPKIIINSFQLAVLLNEEEKKSYEMILKDNTWCAHCEENAFKGVSVNKIHLNDFNDIMIEGVCKGCKGKVVRIFEFGEDPIFYQKAMKFREQIKGNHN